MLSSPVKALRRQLRPLRRPVDRLLSHAWNARERLRNLREPPLVVLIYHRVVELSHDPQRLAVRPDRFREHIRALRASFDILRFEQDWSSLTRPAVVLTFDDGYADNLEHALPILKQLHAPATFFIATGYVGGSREFWWDELERVLLRGGAGQILQHIGPVTMARRYDGARADEREALYHDLHPRLKQLSIADREAVLVELNQAFADVPGPRATHRVMRADEVVQMGASEVVTLGAHTVWHQPLSSLSAAVQREEIECSRAALQAWTTHPVSVFSYPFGNHDDYTPQTVALCRDLGFDRVAANHPGVVRAGTDPMQVPRFLVRDWSANELMQRLRHFAGLQT